MSDLHPDELRDDGSPAALETVPCPECGAPAEVVTEGWSESTHGPVEHVRIWCIRWHFFFMPRPPATLSVADPPGNTRIATSSAPETSPEPG
jgi:hypothetical protein